MSPTATDPAAVAPPAPVVPVNDPSTGADDALLAEAAARQITSASLSSYGSLPNPQLAFESITTGATPTIASMILAGNPLFASELAGAPAGASQLASPYPQVPSKINDPAQSLWAFDPKQYQAGLHDQLEQDQNSSWRSFGQMPEMNFGWMNSVRASAPDAVKRWQQLFKDKGFYAGQQNYQTSGVWDRSTETAFQGFMTQWATPYALFSTDATTKKNANMFLSGLTGLDTATLETSIGRDPSTLAQIAQGWMAAQGPDSGQGDQKSELQRYADTFGLSALPDSYQALLHTDFLTSLRDTVVGAPIIGLLNDIPGVSSVWHGAVNTLTGNLDLGHLLDDPRKTRADAIKTQMEQQDKLSAADVQNLSPALQAVQDDAGFLGFMNSYDNARTTGILAIWNTMKEGVGQGKWENPFDPLSTPRIEAAAAGNNLAAGIFGQSWAQDNPVWATMFNIATNIVDDPTSYIPLVGELEMIRRGAAIGEAAQHGFGAIRTVGRMIGKDEAMRAFADVNASTARLRINQGFFNAARTAYKSDKLYGLGDVAQMFGLSGDGVNDTQKLQLIQKAMDHPDQHAAWDLFSNGDQATDPVGFGYLMNSGRGVFNAQAAWKGLAQIKSQAVLGKVRTIGGFDESPLHYALTNPVATSQFLTKAAVVAGMAPTEIRPIIDAYVTGALTDANSVTANMQKAEKAIVDAYFRNNNLDQAAFRRWVGTYRAGKTYGKDLGMSADDRVNLYGPHPETGAETSLAPAGATAEAATASQAALHVAQRDLMVLKETGAPEEAMRAQEAQIAALQDPKPMLTTQLADQYHFPYSIYEMVAYKNPALRYSSAVQSALHADAVMATWKRLTIARISSALRMDIGDDIIRPFTMLIGQNKYASAFQYLGSSILKATGLLVPGARKRVLANLDGFLERNPEAHRMMQTMGKMMNESDTRVFVPRAPTDVGYAQALQHLIRFHFSADPLAQTWLRAYSEDAPTAARDALSGFVKQSDDPKVTAWVQAQRGDLNDAAHQAMVDRFDQFMQGYTRNPTLRAMLTTGKASPAAIGKLVRDHANRPDSGLPIIPARQSTGYATNMVSRWMKLGPEAVFEHVTAPMIDQARAGGFMKMKGLYEQQMRKYFAGQPRAGTQAFEKQIDAESTSRAIDWIINNTYQGTRSVFGGTMRNILPFYGATANMDKFYMRQAATTPFLGSVIAHAATASSRSQNAANSASPGMTGLQGVLAHLGFGAGEGVQFNPLHAFFLTSDGIGSMVPGTGPLFAPIWNAISGNANLAQLLADIVPGASTQIDYNTGQAKPQFTWLADLLAGASLALTGRDLPADIPILGGQLSPSQDSINSRVDAKVQEWERNKQGSGPGGTVTDADMDAIRRELGRDLALQGGLSYTLPVSPTVVNTQQQGTGANLDLWRQQTTDAGKDTVILQSLPGVTAQQWQAALANTPGTPSVGELIAQNPNSDAALMAYQDHRVSAADRDAIANAAPWVVSTAQSKYQTASLGPNMPDRPFDLPQWQLMRRLGDITTLTPEQFTGQVANERDINTGWLEYDNLKNQEYAAMVANGWTTNSPQYQAWNQAVFQPQLINIQNNHASWWKQFGSGGGNTASDLAGKTRALRTLQTWEVLPQHSDFESQQSILWRNAIQLRDNAAGQLYSLKVGGGTTAEQQMVMQTFQSQLAALAQRDPTFAAQLSGFRFSSWEDVVTLEADEMQANMLSGYPAQPGLQGAA